MAGEVTPAPVEIARKVLEVGDQSPLDVLFEREKIQEAANAVLWTISPIGPKPNAKLIGRAVDILSLLASRIDWIILATNGAKALAEDVQRYEAALRAIESDLAHHEHCECSGIGACQDIALAALSPTEGDGRT